MGADGAFERRRMELAVIARAAEGVEPPEEALEQLDARPDEPAAEMQQMQAEAAESITDEAVVRSFQQQVDPAADSDSAFHLEYLRLGQLAHVCGDVLFVHGGVTTVNMGWVPGRPERVADARVWVDELNAWAAAQLEDFCESLPSGSQLAPRAAEALMDYGLPGGNDGRTVVYSSYLVDGNGAQQPAELCAYLSDAGINTVVSGHTPHGDAPNPMDTTARADAALRVVSADTSYSHFNHTSAWGVDNRGAAVAAVEVSGDGRVAVRGALADGRAYAYQLAPPGVTAESEAVGERGGSVAGAAAAAAVCDPYVGKQLADGRWVKALLLQGDEDGDDGDAAQYLLVKGQGFTLTKSFASRAELAQERFV